MKRALALAAAASLAFALEGAAARAQAPRPGAPSNVALRAEASKREGDRLLGLGRAAEALTAYTQSYALVADVEVLYRESRAYQALGRYPEALDVLSRFQVEAPFAVRERVHGLGAFTSELFAKVAALDVRCEIEGAEVKVGGRSVGTTPLPAPFRTNAGRAIVTVTKEGYVPFAKELDLRGGETTWLPVVLERVVREGTLHVDVPGNGAVVSVDGRPVGVTPLDVALAPGAHAVVVHREGSLDASTSVVIVAGQTRDLSLSLTSKIHVGTWWIWTSLGLAVVVGTVLAYALTTEKPHSSGDHFSPGVTAEPLVRW
jgi:hypothetical protein